MAEIKSSFKSLLRLRFEGKDNNVPWELDNKVNANNFVRGLGFKTPLLNSFDKVEKAVEWAEEVLGATFVIKGGDLHSSKGVYLLRRLEEEKYIDLMTKEIYASEDIGKNIHGRQPTYWVAETLVNSYILGKDIPLDYKFYCFGKRVALIIQIDRNSYPAKVSVFDGTFTPLKPNVDYFLDGKRWVYGNHLIPVNFSEMLHMARKLSIEAQTKFTSIDLFDSLEGPVFGEFTFAPGALDSGMIDFSDRVLEILDSYTLRENVDASISGFNVREQDFWHDCDTHQNPNLAPLEIATIPYKTASLINGDKRVFDIHNCTSSLLHEQIKFSNLLIQASNGGEGAYFAICSMIKNGKGYLNRTEEYHGFNELALEYYRANQDKGDWYKVRYQQVKINFYNCFNVDECLNEIQGIAEANNYEYAKNVIKFHNRNKL